jgi:hypothetical protein
MGQQIDVYILNAMAKHQIESRGHHEGYLEQTAGAETRL